MEEFVRLVESGLRCVYVSERSIDLTNIVESNTIFVLQLPEGLSTAVGSRGGGFGSRRILKVQQYLCRHGDCSKVSDSDDQKVTESLDLPYHAAAFPIVLPDGREKIVSGVADPSLVAAYRSTLR